MAWDTERTKRLLLEAATTEFGERGLAGARVDRIAAAAGVNKERIYKYFGAKDQLFTEVVNHEINELGDAVHLEGHGAAAVADYAQRFFDHICAHPALARLLFWEGLELGTPVAEAARHDSMTGKIADIRRAAPQLSEAAARELLLTILSLCYSWHGLTTLDRLITGETEPDTERRVERRAAIGRMVAAAVEAG